MGWLKFLTVGCIAIFGLITSVSGCADGLVSFGDACYFFSHETENWMEAEEMCRALLGGMLVEIGSEAEYNFINQEVHDRTAVTDRYWVGATDVIKEGHWVWRTSQTDVKGPSYVTFYESNSGGNENCMEVGGNAFNDVACAAQRHYICEVSSETGQIFG